MYVVSRSETADSRISGHITSHESYLDGAIVEGEVYFKKGGEAPEPLGAKH